MCCFYICWSEVFLLLMIVELGFFWWLLFLIWIKRNFEFDHGFVFGLICCFCIWWSEVFLLLIIVDLWIFGLCFEIDSVSGGCFLFESKETFEFDHGYVLALISWKSLNWARYLLIIVVELWNLQLLMKIDLLYLVIPLIFFE